MGAEDGAGVSVVFGKYLSEASFVSFSSKAFSLARRTLIRFSFSVMQLSKSTIFV